MGNSKAKQIRKAVYGELATNRKGRKYYIKKRPVTIDSIFDQAITIVADKHRRTYQAAKKLMRGKTIFLLLITILTTPGFTHIPCKQWAYVDTVINGKEKTYSVCSYFEPSQPCPELIILVHDTLPIHDTIWLASDVHVECPELQLNIWDKVLLSFAGGVLGAILGFCIVWILGQIRKIFLNITRRMRHGS